ncbi:hypothetical protein [Maribacter sp. 2210JD10-5]|uniref:hypothetical protein n=1 Tax=Maribacter sp. 2210JD10-5 TaxID=3386272 RepID=UPI0039BCA4BC
MKKYSTIVLILVGLLLNACFSGDDGITNRFIELRLTDALTFENEGNYVVGDTIFIELNFSRYLEEEGFTNLLDVYESTNAKSFGYSFRLEKFSELGNSYIGTTIDGQFLFAEKGRIGPFETIDVVLNDAEDTYESRIGIILAETGNFRFNFDFLSIFSQNVDFDKVNIEIQHLFNTAVPEDFEFTVNE